MVVTPIIITKGPNGYGMILKSIRVYIGDTYDYRIHHIIEVNIGDRYKSLTLFVRSFNPFDYNAM